MSPMKRNLLIFAGLLLFGVSALWAQPGHTSMDIIGSYRPRIPDVQKILEQPSIVDSGLTKFPIDYELHSRRVNTAYEVDPIKAANMRGEKLSKLYNGYVRGGFGTYTTPYGELFYTSGRSKKFSSGVHYRHLSSSGQLADVGYSGFSQNDLNLFGKSFIKKSTLSGGLDYSRNVVHYYGFNTNPIDPKWDSLDVDKVFNLERDGIRQRYQLVQARVGLNDIYPVDSMATKYMGGMKYYNYRDRFNAEENMFGMLGQASFYYKTYDVFVRGGFDYFKYQVDTFESQNTLYQIRPGIRFKKPVWRLVANLAFLGSAGETSEFKVAPELDFDLHLFRDILILNIGTDSKYSRNSYRGLTAENPFLIDRLELRNTWKPMRLYAGLRGAVSSRLAFNLKASYVQITNQVYFVNDTSLGNWNKMNVVWDNPSLFEFNGELTWQKHDKIRLAARCDYYGFTADGQLRAWHTPSLRITFSGKYNLKDKIWLNASLVGLNRQFARDFIYAPGVAPVVEERRLNGLADINLGAEYRYTRKLGMFVQINNLLNVRYSRYLNYPTQRFALLAGISYSFASERAGKGRVADK